MKKFELKVEDKDMLEAAKAYAAYQYAMYGMGNVPEELLTDAAAQMLKDERQMRNIEENVENEGDRRRQGEDHPPEQEDLRGEIPRA